MCKHSWEVVSEVVLDSPFEQTTKEGTKNLQISQLDERFFQKKFILVLKCLYCGKLDKTEKALF
jgi:hypothetical protein